MNQDDTQLYQISLTLRIDFFFLQRLENRIALFLHNIYFSLRQICFKDLYPECKYEFY